MARTDRILSPIAYYFSTKTHKGKITNYMITLVISFNPNVPLMAEFNCIVSKLSNKKNSKFTKIYSRTINVRQTMDNIKLSNRLVKGETTDAEYPRLNILQQILQQSLHSSAKDSDLQITPLQPGGANLHPIHPI